MVFSPTERTVDWIGLGQ